MKAFAPSILHRAINSCPKHIFKCCPFRLISRALSIKKIKQNITYKYMVAMEAGSYITIFIRLLLGCAIQSGLINVFMDNS